MSSGTLVLLFDGPTPCDSFFKVATLQLTAEYMCSPAPSRVLNQMNERRNERNLVVRGLESNTHKTVRISIFSVRFNWKNNQGLFYFQWLRKWQKKCDDDSETSNWISANTKVSHSSDIISVCFYSIMAFSILVSARQINFGCVILEYRPDHIV